MEKTKKDNQHRDGVAEFRRVVSHPIGIIFHRIGLFTHFFHPFFAANRGSYFFLKIPKLYSRNFELTVHFLKWQYPMKNILAWKFQQRWIFLISWNLGHFQNVLQLLLEFRKFEIRIWRKIKKKFVAFCNSLRSVASFFVTYMTFASTSFTLSALKNQTSE